MGARGGGIACALAVLVAGGTARAAEFVTTASPIIGCSAQNGGTLVLVAFDDGLSLAVASPRFDVKIGHVVHGMWAVDAGRPAAFTWTVDVTNTVTIDLTWAPATVAALSAGTSLEVTAEGEHASFSLNGVDKALTDLAQCLKARPSR